MPRYIVIDTETGGFDPKTCGVCEVAWVEVDADLNVIDRFHSLVDPVFPISPSASGVHGILDADVADSPTMAELMTEVLNRPFAQGPFVFIAHNSSFDWKFLREWFPEDTKQLCTLRAAKKIFPDAPDFKLQTLRVWRGLGVNRGDAHSAAGDVDALLEFLVDMVKVSGKTLDELTELATAPISVKKMPFGKHKGTALRELPRDYVSWLFSPKGPDNLDPDLKASFKGLMAEGVF